ALKGIEHDLPLELRRDAAGPLVNRHDPSRMDRLALLGVEDLVLRIGHRQPSAFPQLDDTEEDNVLASHEHVAKKRLIQPYNADRPARVGHERLEDLEAWPSGRTQRAADDFHRDRDVLTGLERRDVAQAAAIFVADRKTVKEVFDGLKPGALEVRSAPRS